MDKMRMESINTIESNIDKIGVLFPNCVTESVSESGRIVKSVNFELLRQMLESSVVESDEVYEFSWVGKRASIVEANRPIRKTFRPRMVESLNWDNTENVYIRGDNLEALKLMQESYLIEIQSSIDATVSMRILRLLMICLTGGLSQNVDGVWSNQTFM